MLEELEVGVRRWVGTKVCSSEYSCVRDAVIASERLIVDHSDGVWTLVDPTIVSQVFHGVEVVEGWDSSGSQVLLCRQLTTGRTHHQYWAPQDSRRLAVKEALAAWNKQRKLERQKLVQERDLLKVFQGENISHLVTTKIGGCAIPSPLPPTGSKQKRRVRVS
jgi:hypothetical protein